MAHLAGADGAVIRDAVARDELVGNLLLVHGLHPSDVEARARGALDTLAERLASHGARAELARVDGGVARVRLYGKNGGCGSSTETLRRTIQESLMAVAPELDDVDVEHVVPPTLLQIGVRPSAAAMSRATS
jgi:Fe-S cluster biogenesis protein NfuA